MMYLRFRTSELSTRFGWLYYDQGVRVDGNHIGAYRCPDPDI